MTASQPLQGKRIIITRSREQAGAFQEQLAKLGAEVILLPAIEIRDPDSWAALDEAIGQIDQYHWLIFTSVNGVSNFFKRLAECQKDASSLRHLKISAIGPATAKAAAKMGLQVATVPEEFKAEGLLQSLEGKISPGMRVLIPRAKVARDVLPDELRSAGARVDVVEAYQTSIPAGCRLRLAEIMTGKPVSMIVFTSSSTVSNLAEIVRPAPLADLLRGIQIACIGPITAETAQKHGLEVAVSPSRYDIPTLVEAIATFYA